MRVTNQDWKLRFRQSEGGLSIHMMNKALEGIEKPGMGVLDKIISRSGEHELVVEIDITGLEVSPDISPVLMSPELPDVRRVRMERVKKNVLQLSADLSGIRLYGFIRI
jgi:hypothetical protein